jgi:heat shock protein HslJ
MNTAFGDKRLILLSVVLAGLMALTGACAPPVEPVVAPPVATATPPPPEPSPTPESPAAEPLTEEILRNSAYELPDLGTITLIDGEYEEQYGEGATQVNKAGLIQAALGDLNGDGRDDAAVSLWWSGGGSGTFIYLVVAVDQDGAPQQVAAEFLGDRVPVQSLTIEQGHLLVEAKGFAPDDPMCCPSLQVTRIYRLSAEALEVVEETLVSPVDAADLAGAPWVLEGFGREGGLEPVLDGTEITLEFDADAGQVGGSGGCNNFFGGFQLEGNQLSFGPLGSTMMACEPAVMDQEIAFLAALQAAESVELQDERLTIASADGEAMVFAMGDSAAKVIESEIVGVIWEWVRFIDTAGIKDITVPDPPSYSLELHPDGRFSLKADCNRASGTYTLEDSGLTLEFGPMTVAECEAGSLYDEFIDRLVHVVTFVHQDDQLYLNMWADGGDLVFRPAEQVGDGAVEMADLTGVLWVLDGSEITLEFDAEAGQVAGSAGCNSYFGSFHLEGNQLRFGPLGATRMACESAIMDQETAFLDGLQMSESVQVEDGRLTITYGDDQALVFVAGDSAAEAIESEIVGVIWEWERFIDTAGINDIVVPHPPSYRLVLHPDGRFDLKADCNRASGTYTLVDGSGLTLEFGPMTLAECEDGSLYNEYINRLGYVVTFVHQGDQLYLNMWADGGDLVFRRLHAVTGTIVAPGLEQAAEVEARIVDTAGVQVGGSLRADVSQFPHDFEAPYYPPSVQPDETYLLEVTVRDESGNPIYVNTQEYPVITQGNPTYHLEVLVEPVEE